MTTVQSQYLRVFSKPLECNKEHKYQDSSKKHTQEAERIKSIVKPFGGLVLSFDTETTTGTAQTLRFGFYEVHGLTKKEMFRKYREGILQSQDVDTLRECGIFYQPGIKQDELELLQKYAASVTPEMIAKRELVSFQPLEQDCQAVKLLTKQEFIERFYSLQRWYEMLVIGHNMTFDLGVLSTSWKEGGKDAKNGFSLKLCDCLYENCVKHPNIRIKHAGYAKSFIKRMKHNWNTKIKPVHFLDTMTLSASLLGTAHSLDSLSRILLPGKLQKRDRPDSLLSGESLSLQDVIYGCQDVHTTWACYRELKKHFNMHNVSSDIWYMYSSASVGKAHIKEFGVRPFLEQHKDFSEKVLGYSMNAYYGARCEIGIRLKPVECIYLDFLSQYPTVNALMKNQDVLLAERVEVENNIAEIKALLDQDVNQLLDWLHHPGNWQYLKCFVKVLPQKDRLPLRSDYGREAHNVGLPYVTSSTPVWYTLADVIASKLLTDKTPVIVESIKLVPSQEKYKTEVRNLFGYEIDLETQDFFKTLIEIRQEVKKKGGELADNQQLALKLISNATSYGALVEVQQDETTVEAIDALFYDLEGQEQHTKIHRVEKPGKFFAGPIGALIPASGRLLLAIAQRLTNDRCMVHAMMDTDSIVIARPDEIMSREEFRANAQEVANWFSAISPYEHNKKVLELEKINYWNGELEPLYFLGVSAKRYVVYNKLPGNRYRIRKFSSHGLGGIHAPYVDSPFSDIPLPCENVHKLGGKRWCYDMWYRFIEATEKGEKYSVSERLEIACYHQSSISTWKLYEQFKTIPGARPFGFFSVLPSKASVASSLKRAIDEELEMFDAKRQAYIHSIKKPFYAPYASKPEELHDIKSMDDNSLVPDWYSPVTVKEVVREYFCNREWKAINGNEIGIMLPHNVIIGDIIYVGKEINNVALEQAEESGALLGEILDVNIYGKESTRNWQDVLSKYHITDISLLTGLSGRGINKIKAGKSIPTEDSKRMLREAIIRLDKEGGALKWRGYSDRELATRLDVSLEYIKGMKYGKIRFTDKQREILLSM